jgi:hypothetical protein
MIIFNNSAKTFESKFKSYPLKDINENLIYQWIKSGDLSLSDFKKWYSLKMIETSKKTV